MQIDWSCSNGAPAGCRHTSPTETGDQWSQHQKRRAHGFHQIIRCLELLDPIGLELQLGGAIKPTAAVDPFADPGKKLQSRPNISEMRNFLVDTGFCRQQGRDEYWQCSILRATHRHLSSQLFAAL